MTTAITADSFLNTLGVNTHIGSGGTYSNLSVVEQDLSYLGVPIVRDTITNAGAVSQWQQVAQASGIKFDDVMPEGAPAWDQSALALVPQLQQDGLLAYIEGGNEEDDSYALSTGNSLAWTAAFQQQVYAMGQQEGLPVINMSFGSGWTAANNWVGDYPNVGDLSAYTTYANAHTYPSVGQTPDWMIQQLNADAKMAAGERPVITTEMGWQTDQFSGTQIAQAMVAATFDGIKDGDAGTWFYGLYDDASGNWGLFNSDGSARPSATAMHNLTTLLQDSGSTAASFQAGSLDYSLSGTQSGDNSFLMQKSDGTFWIGLWNESAGQHSVTLTLPSAASSIEVYDPITGTSAVQSASNSGSISVSLGSDPLLVEVVPSGTGTPTTATSVTTGSTQTTGASASSSTDNTATGTGSAGSSAAALTDSTSTGTALSTTTTSDTPPSSGNTISIAADDASPVVTASNTTISATSGDHMVFIAGTGDTATLTGGTETVQSYVGGNTITTGAGDDTIRFAGAGNVVDAGAGNNTIDDSGSNGTIVLPGTDGNDDVFGWVMQNGDTFDLRGALASTSWDGSEGTLAQYLSISNQNVDTVVTLHPDGGSTGSVIATLHDTGSMTLAGFLSHAVV